MVIGKASNDTIIDLNANKTTGRRRAVACRLCHTLKVKCIPSDPNDLASACVRCLKGNKVCEIDIPVSRKKRKPNEDRVAELESQVRELTEKLNQQASSSPIDKNTEVKKENENDDNQAAHSSNNINNERNNSNNSNNSNMNSSGNNNNNTNSNNNNNNNNMNNADEVMKSLSEFMNPQDIFNISSTVTNISEARLSLINKPYSDVINEGIISESKASLLLKSYHEEFYAKYPFIIVPNDLAQLRNEMPYLFACIMCITLPTQEFKSEEDFNIFFKVEQLAMEQTIHQVLIIGNKSVELLKCLSLLSIWYNTAELFHNRRYHIINSLCINMVNDLGFTGRPYYIANKNEGSLSRVDNVHTKDEHRSLVMITYASSVGYSLFLRRRLLVTWTPFMEECFQILKISEDINLRTISVFAKLSSFLEKIHSFVTPGGDSDNFSLLQYFQQEFNELKGIQTTMNPDVYLGFIYSIEAFLYSKYSEPEIIVKCYDACKLSLTHFGNLTAQDFKNIPLLISGRLMYCFALLLKTINHMKYDFDYTISMNKILLVLKESTEKFTGNQLLLKLRLLFYFYFTTFCKNGNVFNNIDEMTSNNTIVNEITTNNNSNNTNYVSPPTAPQDAQNFNDIKSTNPSVFQYNYDQQQSHQPQNISFASHNNNTANNNSHNPDNGLSDFYVQNGELYNLDNDQPRLDILSDAMAKGDIPIGADQLGQDDFWKMFDARDEQFFL